MPAGCPSLAEKLPANFISSHRAHSNGVLFFITWCDHRCTGERSMGSAVSSVTTRAMGECINIDVYTGDKKGAGTDANVWICLSDDNNYRTTPFKLNKSFRNDHERGQKSSFVVTEDQLQGRILEIEFWRDNFGLADDWFVDKIEVTVPRHGDEVYSFPIQRWIKANKKYIVKEYDCCLPQCDPYLQYRNKELGEKKAAYRYRVKVPGLPVQIDILPEDEAFSEKYFMDFATTKLSLLAQTKVINWTTDQWESLEDLKKVYRYSLGEPESLNQWREDFWFGLQRIQGIDPLLIRLCYEIPSKFGVDDSVLELFLEGQTLAEALDRNKIFIIDLEMLEGLPSYTVICAPLALFYLNKKSQMFPIAIQLNQHAGPDNPVFYPSDPHFTWVMAKMWYNSAESHHHQSCAHLGFTHLLMEGVCICTHRNLSPSHPLFKLMAPHFLFLLAINDRGLQKLLNPGGWIDCCMAAGVKGVAELIGRGIQNWRFDVNGTIPEEIKSRGLLDPKVLPYYPYRDDAVELFETLRRYVAKVVNNYYKSQSDIDGDEELSLWIKELAREVEEGGVGMQGVFCDPEEGFTSPDQITSLVTAIISTCSLGHAAANFQQYEAYGFPPNYPSKLLGTPPTNKDALTAEDIIRAIPSKKHTLDTMVITKLLSMKGTKSLGDFEVQYLFHPGDVEAADSLKNELEKLSKTIKQRNKSRQYPYLWLDPTTVPNSISV